MMEISAGGVVFNSNRVLLLLKSNGTWVLPKGHVEKGENFSETALREVKEECGVEAELGEYIDFIEYNYFNFRKMKKSHKTVHWFTMHSNDFYCVPLQKEGFVKAKYVDAEKALDILVHEKEQFIIRKAIEIINTEEDN